MRAFLARPADWLSPAGWWWLSIISLLALIVVVLLWSAWLAPAAPQPIWLAIKALPLLLPLRGLLHGRRSTAQWAALLAVPYFLGALVAVYGYLAEPHFTVAADFGPALAQLLSATGLMAGTSFYAYLTRYQMPREG